METKKIENLFSLEGKEFVKAVFRTFLFREADPAGEKNFLKQLAEGQTKDEMVLDVLSSEESRVKYSQIESVRMDPFSAETLISVPDDGVFLRSAYLVLLGRPIDPTGLEHFQNGLWNCTLDRTDIILALMRSQEGKQHGIRLLGFEKRRRNRALRNLVYGIPFFGRLIRFLRTQKFKTAVLSQRLAELSNRIGQIEQREQRVQALEQRMNEMIQYSEPYFEAGLTEDEKDLYRLMSEGVRR